MSKLTASRRNALPDSAFAGPDRSYPIMDRSHAANAKARVADKSPALRARVDAAVARRYPDMGRSGGSKLKHERGASRGFINKHGK